MFRSSSVWPSRRLLIDSFWKNCVLIMRKLKLRLPNQEQYVKEANAFIVVFTVVGASMLFFSVFVFFWYDNFVFIYLLIFFLFRHQYLLLFFVHLFVCLFFQSFLSFNLKISTSVLKCYTPAVLMHFAITPKGHTIVHVNMDLLEMDENVKVNVGVEI